MIDATPYRPEPQWKKVSISEACDLATWALYESRHPDTVNYLRTLAKKS